MNVEQAVALRSDIIEGAWNHMLTVTPDTSVLGDGRLWKAAFEQGFQLALQVAWWTDGPAVVDGLEHAIDAAALTADTALMYEDMIERRRNQGISIAAKANQLIVPDGVPA